MIGLPTLAAEVIGKPWERGAAGPGAYDCWGLVRVLTERMHGDALAADPRLAVVQALSVGWVTLPEGATLRQGDVLLMLNSDRERHTGIVLLDLGRPRLLHAVRGWGVGIDDVHALPRLGYSEIRAWRRLCTR